MFNLTPMVRNLLLLNLAVFLLSQYGVIPVEQFALYHFQSEHFRPYQFITHMFLHAGWGHIFSNMLSLFFFGPLLEHHWGSKRFLTFYLICGFGASVLYSGVRMYELSKMEQEAHVFMQEPTAIGYRDFMEEHASRYYSPELARYLQQSPENPDVQQAAVSQVRQVAASVFNSPMLGASGAVFGILMAFGLLFPNIELFLLFFPIPIKAKYFVLLYGAYELYAGFNRVPGDNVAHFAHLGGMLFAYILIRVWNHRPHDEY